MERDDSPRRKPSAPATMRLIFGVFMIIFYVAIGVLILTGTIFDFSGNWEWLRWTAGIILVLYGIWRGYRQFAGTDSDD